MVRASYITVTDVKIVLSDGKQVHLLLARIFAHQIYFSVGICKGQVHCYLKTAFKTLSDFAPVEIHSFQP